MDATVGGAAGILDGVVHKVREDLVDYGEVHADHPRGVSRADHELHAGLMGLNGEPRGDAVEELGRGHDLAALPPAAAFEPGKGEDVLDEVAEAVGLGAESFEVM